MLLNAVLCVRNEADIIESTVTHAFAQGCAQVFLIDNGSTDDTVAKAIHAGARLADSFTDKYFDETQKISRLNSVVKRYNDQSAEEHLWWLYLDADEFPDVDREGRILDFLQASDSSVRLVHGHMFDHVPTHPPYHIPGRHPADLMPVAEKSRTSKIPLIRYDKGKAHLYSCGGAHSLDTAGESLPIVKDVLDIHHFPYRKPEHTLARLKLLVQKDADGSSRVDWCDERARRLQRSPAARSDWRDRCDTLQEVYRRNQDLALMRNKTVYHYKNLTRWYDAGAPIPRDGCSAREHARAQAVHYFFLGEHDLALCSLRDACDLCRDDKERLILHGKMALCLAKTRRDEAIALIGQLQNCPFPDVTQYAAEVLRDMTADEAAQAAPVPDDQGIRPALARYFGKYEEQLFV